MANLAIKGHPTKGNEVIKILEMLGGVNFNNHDGCRNMLYFISTNKCEIMADFIANNPVYNIYTLETFLEKNPYKVGDKVIYKSEVLPIIGMKWDCYRNIVIYTMKTNCRIIDCYDNTWMKPYKEESMDKGIIYDEIDFNRCPYADKVELILGDNYEIQVAEGKTYVVKKKPQYPKTFIEVLNFWHPNRQLEDDYQRCYKKDLIEKFQDLLYARDAYWKMAGDWKPDITNDEVKFVIAYCCGNVYTTMTTNFNRVLVFPTEEMRDAFYDNFKDLIEECKELL